MTRQRVEGCLLVVLFGACIPAANWLIGNVGSICVANGPCLIPVAPGGLTAPSGVIAIGIALVLRDLVQRRLGAMWALATIAAGSALAGAIAPASLVVASAAAFLLSELADFAVYTPLHRRGLVMAVAASGAVGIVIDSFVFLQLAFGSLDYLFGQIVGKAWAILLTLPAIAWLRQRDERLGLIPA